MAVMRLKAHHYRHIHAALTIVWTLLGVPTLLWWKDSVPWVVLMSWYAIITAHAAAWQATRAEEQGPGDT